MSRRADGERPIAGWIPPTVAYIVLLGAASVLGAGGAWAAATAFCAASALVLFLYALT
jgi:hypothetical protein